MDIWVFYICLRLYHRQFDAAAAHNRWTEMEKAVALTVHLKGAAQQVLAALLQSYTIEYATLVNSLEQKFRQKHHALVKKRELSNRIQKYYILPIDITLPSIDN